jgi:hypothetical protein
VNCTGITCPGAVTTDKPVHPDGMICVEDLEPLGYETVVPPTAIGCTTCGGSGLVQRWPDRPDLLYPCDHGAPRAATICEYCGGTGKTPTGPKGELVACRRCGGQGSY